MKRVSEIGRKAGVLLVFLFLSLGLIAQTAEDREIISDAEQAKEAFIAEDPAIENMFNEAEAYAIFPNVGKGAYIVGGASGNGAVYQQGELIGMTSLKQLDVGLQLGGQAFSQVIFFQNASVLNNFKEGNYELSGNASAVALDKGAAESLDFRDGVAIATLPKAGAMIEISVGGQKFEYDGF